MKSSMKKPGNVMYPQRKIDGTQCVIEKVQPVKSIRRKPPYYKETLFSHTTGSETPQLYFSLSAFEEGSVYSCAEEVSK